MKKIKNEGFLSQAISDFLKDKLKDFFINIDFTMSFSNNHFVFYVRDVDIRTDVLKRFGIPLELSQGKVNEIKITITSFTLSEPLSIEVSGIKIDLKTIYLSHKYSKDYKTFKLKVLEEWEKRHKEFLKNLNSDSSYVEEMVIEKLIPSKIYIKNIGIRITDNITLGDQKPKIIGFYIDEIRSFGCNEKYEEMNVSSIDNFIYRSTRITKIFVNIYKEMNKKEYELIESGNFSNFLIQPLNVQINLKTPLKPDLVNLLDIPKIQLQINVESSINIELKNSKLRFLIGFLENLEKVKNIEKYWIYRPEISEEMTHETAKKWLKYAYDVIREGRREKKSNKMGLKSIMEKLVDMEKYIQLYKSSHKLIIAPWIDKLDCEKEISDLEARMSLDDIIHCREISFNELIVEGNKNIGKEKGSKCSQIKLVYNSLMNLWEYYVKDIRGKYLKNNEKNKEEILKERRSLLILSKLEKDNTLLSHLKGEKTNSKDKMINLEVNIKCIIITFSRKVNNKEEVQATLKFFRDIYSSKIKQELQRTHLIKILKSVSKEEMIQLGYGDENSEVKEGDKDNISREDLIKKPTLSSVLKYKIKRSNIFGHDEKFGSRSVNEEIKSNKVKLKKGNSHKVSFNNMKLKNSSRNKYDTSEKKPKEKKFLKSSDMRKWESKTNSLQNDFNPSDNKNNTKSSYNKETFLHIKNSNRKALITFVIGNIDISLNIFRNDQLELGMDINSFNIIDHNLTYARLNKCNNYIMNIEENDLDEIEYLRGKDYSSMLFNINFYEKNMFIHSEKVSDCLPKCLSFYLVETITYFFQKKKNIFSEVMGLFDASLNLDFKFLLDYIFKFGLVKINDKEINTDIQEIYFGTLFSLLLDKLGDNLGNKRDIFSTENEKEIIEKIFDKYNIEQLGITEELKWIEEKNRIIVEDLSFCVRNVYIYLIKFVFSGLYPFYLNEKKFQKYFAKNLLTFVDEYKLFKNKSFLTLKMLKEGKDLSEKFISNEHKENINIDDKVNQDLKGNLKITVNNKLSVKLTNKTIAEFICISPFLTKTTSSKTKFSGNVVADIKKSPLEIHETYRNLKSKWKAINKLLSKPNVDTIFDSQSQKIIEDELNDKINIEISITGVKIKIIDSLIFLGYDKISQAKVEFNNISIRISKLEQIPSLESINNINAFIKHKKFEINSILKAFLKINIHVKNIETFIDSHKLLETSVKVDLIQSLLKNFPLIPDLIIDINIPYLKVYVIPSIMILLKLISNISYFHDLNEKNWKINADIIKILNSEFEKNSDEYYNSHNKSLNFLKKYEKSLEKIYKKANTVSHFSNNTYLDFLKYLKHRDEMIFSLTIGDTLNNNGITIEVCENDSVYREINYSNQGINNSSYCNSSFKSNSESVIEDIKRKHIIVLNAKQIFILHIPFMLFKINDSLYKNYKQLWISDIHCKNTNGEKEFEKIKVKFESQDSIESYLKFSPIEVLFCKELMKSLEFNLRDVIDDGEIKFKSVFPFDKSLKSLSNIKLINVFTQISYYYEDHDILRKLYSNDFKSSSNKRLSLLNLNIKEITFKIFLPPNSCLFNMINQMVNIMKYLDNSDKNKFKLNEDESEISKFNANEKKFVLIKEKLSIQQINIILQKLNVKIYNDRINNHSNFMVILNINNIKYKENMDDEKKENHYLSNLSFKSINVILSIPHKFKEKEDKEIIPGLKSKDNSNIHQKMLEEENHLIVLSIESLSLRVVKVDSIEIEFVIEKMIRLGFLNRKEIHFSISKMDLNNMKPIFWINSSKKIKDLIEENLNSGSFESSNKFMDDIERNKLIDISQSKLENKEFSLKLSLIVKSSNDEDYLNDELFPHLTRMIKEFQRLISLKYQSKLKLNLNVVNLHIPNILFNYLYYLKNYLKKFEESLISKIEIPEMNQVNEDFLNEFINEYKIIRNHKYSKNDIGIDSLKSNKLNIFEIDIPYTRICLKQKISKDKEIEFLNLGLHSIHGELDLFYYDRSKDQLTLTISKIDWKPYESKYNNLVIKDKSRLKESPDFNIIKVEILINTINEEDNSDKVLITVENISFIFLMKTIKEILMFIEENIEMLDDPTEQYNNEDLSDNLRNYQKILLKIKLIDSFLILPESSDSANYLGVKVTNGEILIKETSCLPKLVKHPEDNLLIIEEKTIYNLVPFHPQYNDLISCTEVSIIGTDIFAYFFIDQEIEDLGKIEELGLIIKSPKEDSIVFKLKQLKWQKEAGAVVVAKPSVNINLNNAKITTNIGKLLSFKIFAKSNFDEKSSVVNEVSGKWDSIDFEFKIDNANVSIDIFKIFNEFSDKEVEMINEELPGKNSKISFNFD